MEAGEGRNTGFCLKVLPGHSMAEIESEVTVFIAAGDLELEKASVRKALSSPAEGNQELLWQNHKG